jgi:hypothetical protein
MASEIKFVKTTSYELLQYKWCLGILEDETMIGLTLIPDRKITCLYCCMLVTRSGLDWQLDSINTNNSWLQVTVTVLQFHLTVSYFKVKVVLWPATGQSVFVSNPIWVQDKIFVTVKTVMGLLMWGYFDKRKGLSFITAADPCQCIYSHIWAPSMGCLTLFSFLRFETPSVWRARFPYYIPQ